MAAEGVAGVEACMARRRALHQQVAIGQQGNQQVLDQGLLTDDALLQLRAQSLESGLGGVRQWWLGLCCRIHSHAVTSIAA